LTQRWGCIEWLSLLNGLWWLLHFDIPLATAVIYQRV